MILRRLHIGLMPGIARPFTVEAHAGLNLIQGPNGSGKSTVCRAVRALLWPETESPRPLSLQSRWRDETGVLAATREQAGVTQWSRNQQEMAAPELPDGHLAHCYHLGLLDLIKRRAGPTDRDLATAVLTRMAGGYDVAKVQRELCQISPQVARQEAAQHRECRRQWHEAMTRQEELAQAEDSCAVREREYAAARDAGRRLILWQAARAEVESRQMLARAREQVASYPDSLARMRGDEITELQRIDQGLAAAREELRECQDRLRAEEIKQEEAKLAAGPVDAVALDTWRERARKLGDLERELEEAQRGLKEATANLSAITNELGQDQQPEATPPVGDATIAEAERYLRRLSANAWERRGLAMVSEQLRQDAPSVAAATLDTAVRALEDWLVAGVAAPLRKWLIALIPFKILFIIGLRLVTTGQTIGWALLGGGLLGALFILWLHRRWAPRRQVGDNRKTCRERFRTTGLLEPPDWSAVRVGERLRELREEVVEARLHELRQSLRSELEARRGSLARSAEELSRGQEELARRVGADPGEGAVELLEFVRRVQTWQRQRMERDRLERHCQELTATWERDLAAASAFLTDLGAQPAEDTAAITARLDDLDRRSRQLAAARQIIEREQPQGERLAAKIDDIQQTRRSLFERVGLEPSDNETLLQLANQHASYLDAVKTSDERELLHGEKLKDLKGTPGHRDIAGLARMDTIELDRRIAEDQQQADRSERLLGEMERIKERVEHATRDAAMAQALAGLERTRSALEDRRNDILQRAAGAFLLDRVRLQHEQRSQPAVLKRARNLFAAFTHHVYRLDVIQRDEEAIFTAHDTQQERDLALDELSDGTRAQLLLAARLAFVFTEEQGARPPLFLDESLTASDPERFHAIATSLLEVVRAENRQLFYLTANPADVVAWQQALVDAGMAAVTPVDLRQLRKLQVKAEVPDLAPEPPPPLPAPTGKSAAEYGDELAVPAYDPRLPTGSAHLFHLLRDDLDLLHCLLEARIETVGQLRNASRLLVTAGTITAEMAELLEARADALQAFGESWRIGRGQPVGRAVLADSGAVSERFLAQVVAKAEELAGDGELLLAALLTGQVKGFRKAKLEELREYLTAAGFIDARSLLSEQEINERVLRAVEPHLARRVLTPKDIARLVHILWQAVEPD